MVRPAVIQGQFTFGKGLKHYRILESDRYNRMEDVFKEILSVIEGEESESFIPREQSAPMVTQAEDPEVDAEAMLYLSKSVGRYCRHIGYQLKLDRSIIREIEFGQEGDYQSMVYNVLHFWRQHNGKDAKYGALEDALKSFGTEFQDTLRFLKARRERKVQAPTAVEIYADVPSKESACPTRTGTDNSYLCAAGTITNEGGLLSIGYSGAELYVPPDALPEGKESVFIQMRIIPRGLYEDVEESFTAHSTVIVEVLPSGLKLRRRVKLTLPHCLKLQFYSREFVQIFQSHHKQGEPLVWDDVTRDTECRLTDTNCQMWLQHFSWTKYEIAGEIVLAKKLILFAACEKFRRDSRYLTIEAGYHPDMAGANSVFKARSHNWYVGCIQEFLFQKDPQCPLKISLTEINPPNWTPTASSKKSKSISYKKIASSTEQTVHFFLERRQESLQLPRCAIEMETQDEISELNINTEKGTGEDLSIVESQISSVSLEDDGGGRGTVGSSGGSSQGISRDIPIASAKFHDQSEFGLLGSRPYQQIAMPRAWSMSSRNPSTMHEGMALNWCNPGSLSHGFDQHALAGISGPTPAIFEELSYTQILRIGRKLNVSHPFEMDWKYFASLLGFTVTDIDNLAQNPNPTKAVITAAAQKSVLKSKEQLIDILREMEREDCVACLSISRE